MAGKTLLTAVLGASAFVAGLQLGRPVVDSVASDARVLYVAAEFEMAIGNSATAARLMQKSVAKSRSVKSANAHLKSSRDSVPCSSPSS